MTVISFLPTFFSQPPSPEATIAVRFLRFLLGYFSHVRKRQHSPYALRCTLLSLFHLLEVTSHLEGFVIFLYSGGSPAVEPQLCMNCLETFSSGLLLMVEKIGGPEK